MSTAEERFHAAASQLPETPKPKAFVSPTIGLEQIYNHYWKLGFWITLLSLGVFGSIFILSGLYHLASPNEVESTRGRGVLRGTIIALVLPVILAVIGTVIFIVFVLLASAVQPKNPRATTPAAEAYFAKNHPEIRPTRATEKKLGIAEVPWTADEWQLWLRQSDWRPDLNVSTSQRNAILYKYAKDTTREPLDIPENEARIAIEDELFRMEAARLYGLEQAENKRRDLRRFEDHSESARESVMREFQERQRKKSGPPWQSQ